MYTQTPCKGFGEDIRQIRNAKNISVEEFAWLLKTDLQTVTRLEEEKLHPSSHLTILISDILQLEFKKLNQRIWCDDSSTCLALDSNDI